MVPCAAATPTPTPTVECILPCGWSISSSNQLWPGFSLPEESCEWDIAVVLMLFLLLFKPYKGGGQVFNRRHAQCYPTNEVPMHGTNLGVLLLTNLLVFPVHMSLATSLTIVINNEMSHRHHFFGFNATACVRECLPSTLVPFPQS
ncbi:hypothetical protein BS50DRAFT_386251 [Corynespora cassiicola Philippines]|uniref:Uncharacterized protein n=1 Tax=Corynespora cassiicola Philippines TaxID=1448308 RepID=A0A2T2NP60_CORCC|nr:hypothetical protein BS50DRAFT_386251 [Corynespora cassiicola Philippines]